MASMDPNARLPAGDLLLLATAGPATPIKSFVGRMSTRGLQPNVPKPLRPPKERLPVADAVDVSQIRNFAGPSTLAPTQAIPSLRTPPAGGGPAGGAFVFPGGRHNGTAIPPDTTGAVSPTHVFHPLNNSIWYFDRNGVALFDLPLDDFWEALLNTNYDAFDPRVVYDHQRDRFVFVSVADARKPSSALLLAVSNGPDPTQTWVGHVVSVDDNAQGPVWFDYPTLGFSEDKVTIQINLFRRDNNQFAGSTIYVFDKNSLYAGSPTVQRFVIGNVGGTQHPVVTYDSGVADQFLISRWSGNANGSGMLVVFKVTGNAALGQASLSQIGFINSGGFTWSAFPPAGDFAPQVASPAKVSVGDDRILGACLRHGILYCTHTVMLPSGGPVRSSVQWWEIDTSSWQLNSLGRIDDSGADNFFAFPTIAVNAAGDVALGFSQFSASLHPSASWALKRAGGPMSSPIIFAPGRATYHVTFSGPTNRWGDYSATMVDPLDDLSFWTVQEFADNPRDTWATMWARFPAVNGGGSAPTS